jgi:hypothetical protein
MKAMATAAVVRSALASDRLPMPGQAATVADEGMTRSKIMVARSSGVASVFVYAERGNVASDSTKDGHVPAVGTPDRRPSSSFTHPTSDHATSNGLMVNLTR